MFRIGLSQRSVSFGCECYIYNANSRGGNLPYGRVQLFSLCPFFFTGRQDNLSRRYPLLKTVLAGTPKTVLLAGTS